MHPERLSAIVALAAALAAPAAEGQVVPGRTPAPTARVRATGRGRAPGWSETPAQARLMAKRAAVVEAYKRAAAAMGEFRSSVAAGTGHEEVSGFVRGVELVETRYYRDGDVEVDVEFTVPAPAPPEAPWAPRAGGEALLLAEKGRGPMSEREWKDILAGAGERNP